MVPLRSSPVTRFWHQNDTLTLESGRKAKISHSCKESVALAFENKHVVGLDISVDDVCQFITKVPSDLDCRILTVRVQMSDSICNISTNAQPDFMRRRLPFL